MIYCGKGHAFTKANTYLFNGKRHCRKCRAIYAVICRGRPPVPGGRRPGPLRKNLMRPQYLAKDMAAVYPRPKACECCGITEFGGQGKKLQYDHDHETNHFRGWICHHCNLGMGHLGDDIHGVQKALDYLTKSPYSIFLQKLVKEN